MLKLKKLNNVQERDERFDNNFVDKFEYFFRCFSDLIIKQGPFSNRFFKFDN